MVPPDFCLAAEWMVTIICALAGELSLGLDTVAVAV
jgi:hypothetical protein